MRDVNGHPARSKQERQDAEALNVLSLFSGIGGLDLGLEWAGMTTVGQVEIDPFARSILTRHWPEVPRHDDVRTAAAWWQAQVRPDVDVVAGGYPCQPESTAGLGRSTADARWLWPEMARVVAELRPRYVIGENVMGHRTRGLRFVLRDLERLGYTTSAGIISAASMGAPHLRKRIFVLAHLADTDRAWQQQSSGQRRQFGDGPWLHGPSQCMADANGEPRHEWGTDHAGKSQGGRNADRGGLAGDVANPVVARRGPGWTLGGAAQGDDERRQARGSRSQSDRHGGWAIEPGMGRVAYGVPGRVDRLRTLGNACVPQVAELVGRLVMTGEAWS